MRCVFVTEKFFGIKFIDVSEDMTVVAAAVIITE